MTLLLLDFALFQSTPSAWRETNCFLCQCCHINISIHSLRMEGDLDVKVLDSGTCGISIHYLRMEGDPVGKFQHSPVALFQSTPSAWRETWWRLWSTALCRHFNPLPPHGGRLRAVGTGYIVFRISSHSLRMEGDQCPGLHLLLRWYFNPLPPHGGRLRPWCYQRHGQPFQSTPSAWRETKQSGARLRHVKIFQSTPSAWRETHYHHSHP